MDGLSVPTDARIETDAPCPRLRLAQPEGKSDHFISSSLLSNLMTKAELQKFLFLLL